MQITFYKLANGLAERGPAMGAIHAGEYKPGGEKAAARRLAVEHRATIVAAPTNANDKIVAVAIYDDETGTASGNSVARRRAAGRKRQRGPVVFALGAGGQSVAASSEGSTAALAEAERLSGHVLVFEALPSGWARDPVVLELGVQLGERTRPGSILMRLIEAGDGPWRLVFIRDDAGMPTRGERAAVERLYAAAPLLGVKLDEVLVVARGR